MLLTVWFSTQSWAGEMLEQRVESFVQAFNEQRIDAMLDAVTDDIELVWVNAGVATVDTAGREALRRFLTTYFSANSNVRSRLNWTSASHERVAAMETVRWTGQSGPRSQSSLSVYEFRDAKIRRVFYFPSESVSIPSMTTDRSSPGH